MSPLFGGIGGVVAFLPDFLAISPNRADGDVPHFGKLFRAQIGIVPYIFLTGVSDYIPVPFEFAFLGKFFAGASLCLFRASACLSSEKLE